jgi:uncharacterized damage-inducible protein DinB
MHLISACSHILTQLDHLVRQMRAEDFIRPIDAFNGSTIGQHVRHTLEFFICLEMGFKQGIINYDKRSRDQFIESNKLLALNAIRKILDFITQQPDDKVLVLEVGYDIDNHNVVTIHTNYWRELAYNIEHAVHHMAIIKIGIREAAPYISIPTDFGVAASTVRHHAERTSIGQ